MLLRKQRRQVLSIFGGCYIQSCLGMYSIKNYFELQVIAAQSKGNG
ncbi:hypothetical protein DYY67_0642 [Candidatus Nitrosotalea sp. TS]|nr:hypothetical protein [Candidatus Nitrosotalea sp. TS]